MNSAYQAYVTLIKHVRKVPYERELDWIHEQTRILASSSFRDIEEPWREANQLAAVAKYLILEGRRNERLQSFDPSKPLNKFKDFWAASEAEFPESDDPQLLGLFVMRLTYNQLPFLVYPKRIPQMFSRAEALFSYEPSAGKPGLNIREETERILGMQIPSFVAAAQWTYEFYLERPAEARSTLLKYCPADLAEFIALFLRVASATRDSFRDFAQQHAAPVFRDKAYEFNPLLRYPIVDIESKLRVPYPELIAYAATRGLYFLLSDKLGSNFSRAFGDSFEMYVREQSERKFGGAAVLTEEMERSLGWEQKNNDLTLIIGDTAILLECKTSALFSEAKQTASLDTVRRDITKNIVGHLGKKGLFQLFHKTAAIRNKQLPARLAERYDGVRNIYPVILLYDQIQYANKAETLKNLIDSELRAAGINKFDYQIWHLEELENLYELIPVESVAEVVGKKFNSQRYAPWDLNTFLNEMTHGRHSYLIPLMFIPKGNTPVSRILKKLADR